MRYLLSLLLLALACPAHADCRLLLLGDSNSAMGAPSDDWGRMFIDEHFPGCGFCRSATNGWRAANGLASANIAITFCSVSGTYTVTDMVVMLGTNDYGVTTAAQAAANLIATADIAVARGVVPHILCPMPVAGNPARNDYLREVCERVVAMSTGGYDIVTGSRDLWTEHEFASYSDDGIHLKFEGRPLLVDAVAAEIDGVGW